MNIMTLPGFRSRRLLAKCLFISLAVHTAALTYFYFHPMILQGPLGSLFGMTSAEPTPLENERDEEFAEKSDVLKEVFQSIVVLSPHFQKPYDMVEMPKGIALAPRQEEASDISLKKEESLPLHAPSIEFAAVVDTAIDEMQEYHIPAFFSPPELGAPIASQLQIDNEMAILDISSLPASVAGDGAYEDLMAVSPFSSNASYEADYALNLSPQLLSESSLKIGEDIELKSDCKTLSAPVHFKDLHLEPDEVRPHLLVPKAPATKTANSQVPIAASISDLEQYDFSTLENPAVWNDDFDVEVTFLPNPEGKGYIFSLALKPNYDISSHSLKQNLYFILDRSSTVQKHRFSVFKRAVLKALSSMQKGDTFNILLMDKKITRFSAENRSVTLKNIHAAEEFLDKQEAGGLFSSRDIYSSIEEILPSIPENEEVHTAILLSDGKTSMSTERKQRALKKWVEKNNNKVALYACAVGRDNDLLSLDMLCAMSGGKLLYSDTHASLPRKLAKLVINLKDPVAKDLSLTAIPHNPHSRIELYSAGSHLTSLYSHQPYVVVGQIDDPCSFDLVIQGRHRDQWIAIKKNISFIEGHKGDLALEKQWNAEHANTYYSKFLKEGKAAYLKTAKEILKKSRSEVAFE